MGTAESEKSLEEITRGKLTGEMVSSIVNGVFLRSQLYHRLPDEGRNEFVEEIVGLVTEAAKIDSEVRNGMWNNVELGRVVLVLSNAGIISRVIEKFREMYPGVSRNSLALAIPNTFKTTMRVLANGQDLDTFRVRQSMVRNGAPTMFDQTEGGVFHSYHPRFPWDQE